MSVHMCVSVCMCNCNVNGLFKHLYIKHISKVYIQCTNNKQHSCY